jgi:YHS domain-containing protein
MMASLALFALAACESHPEGTYDRSAHVWHTDQGSMAQDRVSGEPVDVSTAVKREYGGETYYFANEDHAREFMAHPEKYEYENSPEPADYPVK